MSNARRSGSGRWPTGLAGIGPVKSAGNPIKLSDAPIETRRKSPAVGEHTVEIMREVGFSDDEIAELRDAKAIATP